jgi:hypothetical protein
MGAASASAQPKQAELLPGVALSQRAMGDGSPLGGKDSPIGALGSSTATVNRNRANAAQKSL